MIVPQTMNTPLAKFYTSSVICQAIKLFMRNMRNAYLKHIWN